MSALVILRQAQAFSMGKKIRNRMMVLRRTLLQLAASAAALPVVSGVIRAEDYPARPVRVLVGVAAGGTLDIIARLMGQWLSERFGQPFIIENRPGAGTNIATEVVVRAPADGHTLLLVAPPNAINATLYDKLNFDFIRDIAPVASISRVPLVLVVNPSLPARTVPELIAYAKVNARKINMASGGNGTTPHVAGELFKMMAGIDMVHVPYRGAGPAITDLLSGQVQVLFAGTPESIEHIRAGKLRALAVTDASRLELLPEVPTIRESITAYEAISFTGIGAPRNTTAEIIERLNREINAGLADTKIKARIADLGGTVMAGSPIDFGKFVADETEKWAKVVKFSGAKPD
jgi:tripartite-type tricarboxylate transporter receptor subunit TctC